MHKTGTFHFALTYAEELPSETISTMQELMGNISDRYDRIHTILKALLDLYYADYFSALQFYQSRCDEYADEISVLQKYHDDKVLWEAHIKQLVSNIRLNNRYPFITYYKNILWYQKVLQDYIKSSSKYPNIKLKMEQLLRELDRIRRMIITSAEYTRDIEQKEHDEIKEKAVEAQRKFAEQQEYLRRQQERAHHEMRMAQIDFAIRQMAFNAEQEKELNKLRRERRELEWALRFI